jgi:GTP-binding protein Era
MPEDNHNEEIQPEEDELQPDAESQALIEAFLSEDGEVPREKPPALAWHEEELPPDHKSGFVALIGRPNVGKSTLVNAFVGEKVAIVSRKPQTTRRRLLGILTEDDYQIIFIDTPGIHKQPPFRLNEKMIDEAVAAIPDADVILFVVDVGVSPRDEDETIARILKEKGEERPVLFVLNKMDKLTLEEAKERIESYWALFPEHEDSMPTSATKGTNVERLLAHLTDFLPEGPRYFPGGQITDQTEPQIAAELVREAVLRYTYQEVPHSVAVLVENYDVRENDVTYIDARIWVERESQRPIIIGKKGSMLKRIGTAARKELERFIGGQVYLDLWVKVQPEWRSREARLRELGFD